MNNSKFFVAIFAIFLSLFFLTGCFEKKEDVKGKKDVKTTEIQSKEKENKKDGSNVSTTEQPKLKEGTVLRTGGYGLVLPIDFVLDTSNNSETTVIYVNQAENIKVEFSENNFGRNISVQEFGGYAQNLLRGISEKLEIKNVESDKYTDFPFFVISAHSEKEQKDFLIYGFLGNNSETAYMSLWEFNSDNQTAPSKIKDITKTFAKHQ